MPLGWKRVAVATWGSPGREVVSLKRSEGFRAGLLARLGIANVGKKGDLRPPTVLYHEVSWYATYRLSGLKVVVTLDQIFRAGERRTRIGPDSW